MGGQVGAQWGSVSQTPVPRLGYAQGCVCLCSPEPLCWGNVMGREWKRKKRGEQTNKGIKDDSPMIA